MNSELYYTAPSDEAFEEMKKECTAQWRTHDNNHGYVDEKLSRITNIKNVQDNFMYMLAMFDPIGQRAVIERLTYATQQALRERLIAGGNPISYILNLGL